MSIIASTKVTFPGGSISEASDILLATPHPTNPDKILIITAVTPFHPLDFSWQDQPSDKGTVEVNNRVIPIDECLTAAFSNLTQELLIDQEIKVRNIKRDDPNWYFLVAHVVNATDLGSEDLIGKQVMLNVEPTYRLALSKSHTASHFAALALNKITADFWKKPFTSLDALGNPNFDREAIVNSQITSTCSTDYYHIGKSLRKKGFDAQRFFNDVELQQIEININQQLQTWSSLGEKLTMSIEPKETCINEKRAWTCLFPGGKKIIIPCGGTHVRTIPTNEKLSISMHQVGEQDFAVASRLS